MQTLNEILEESRTYWTHEKFDIFFKKIIEEIEALKKQCNAPDEPKVAENWLTPYEFVTKYPAFSPGYLGVLRTNCSDANQKFFKGGSFAARYNANETFTDIMGLPHGIKRVQNIFAENNFARIN